MFLFISVDMAESWTMLMLVWCFSKWMLTALPGYQQPISYYFKAGVWAQQAEGLCSSVWFRRSTQTAQSQLPGLAGIWAKVAKISTNTRGKEKAERERDGRRESKEISGRETLEAISILSSNLSPSSLLPCLPPNARRYRTDFHWAVLFE